MRAYQDALYAVLFELVMGHAVGVRRMQRAVERPENPVGQLLRERAPQYIAWFPDWRSQRNAVKEGLGFSTVGPTEDIGIAFNAFTASGGIVVNLEEKNVIRLSDLLAALGASTALADLASHVATERTTSS